MIRGNAELGTGSRDAILLILVAVMVAFCPVVASDYAFSDDYWVLAMRPSTDLTAIASGTHGEINDGRPLYCIWLVAVMGHFKGIQFLKFARFLAVLGIFLSSILYYKLIERFLLDDGLEAALTAALFAVNPCFFVVGSWAIAGAIGFGVFFALASAWMLLRGEFSGEPARGFFVFGWRVGDALIAGLLLYIAMSTYQPAAMAYWTGALIWIMSRFSGSKQDWIKIFGLGMLFGLVALIYYFVTSLYVDPASRLHVSFNLFHRIAWFVVFPLRTALYYPFIKAPIIWSVFSLVTLAWGLMLYCRQNALPLCVPVLTLLVLPATVLPSLISASHYDVLRIKAAIFGVIILLWCVALKAFVGEFGWPVRLWQLLTAILIFAAIQDEFCLQRYLITPLVREQSAVQIKLLDYFRENPKLDRQIVLLPALGNARFARIQPSDELGLPSTAQPWSANNLVYQVLAGITGQGIENVKNVPVVTNYKNERIPPGAFVIDLREFRTPP